MCDGNSVGVLITPRSRDADELTSWQVSLRAPQLTAPATFKIIRASNCHAVHLLPWTNACFLVLTCRFSRVDGLPLPRRLLFVDPVINPQSDDDPPLRMPCSGGRPHFPVRRSQKPESPCPINTINNTTVFLILWVCLLSHTLSSLNPQPSSLLHVCLLPSFTCRRFPLTSL